MNKTRSSFKSRLTHFVSPKALALSLSTVLSLALLVALALTSLVAPAAGAGGGAANGAPAKATISKVTVNDKKVTVKGKVTLPAGTAPNKAKVVLSLVNNTGDVEQLSTKVDAKRKFKATKSTKLTGDLIVVASVKIGKKTGPQVRKRFAGPPASSNGAGPGGGTKPGGGGAPTGTPLVGLFKFDAGKQAVSGKLSGTYFQMAGVSNADSPFFSKEFTPLRPGIDGGLRTDAYQPAPSPAFDGTDPVSGKPAGNSLASRITLPQTFFQKDFGIVTDSIGRGTNNSGGTTEEPTPLPVILNDHGDLSGQVSAWTAAWSGLWFNQGSPKPNGVSGGGTTPLTGTYDAATGHYAMSWSSLIEGGPFGGFIGKWYLEGTFVPAS